MQNLGADRLPAECCLISPISLQVEMSELGPGEQFVLSEATSTSVDENGATSTKTTPAQTIRFPPAPVGATVTNADGFGVSAIDVHSGSYGSVGGCSMDCDVGNEPFSKFQGQPYTGLFTAARRHLFISAKVAIIASDATLSSPDTTNGQPVVLFNGLLDEAVYDLERDDLKLTFRDNAALAMETDTSARAQTNKTIYEIVSDIALQIGPPQSATGVPTNKYVANDDNTQQTYGTLLASQHSYAEHRISSWAFLNKLAKYLGYVTYVRPEGLLYFGPRRDPNQSQLLLIWGGTGARGDLKTLSVHHTPARNGAFQVQVSSHDINRGSGHVSNVSYVNPEALAFNGLSRPQVVTGETIAQTRAQDGLGQIQVYNFSADGVSPAAAQLEAMGHALDIISHEIILTGSLPGNTGVRVGRPLRLSGTGIAAVDTGSFVIASARHRLAIDGGFETHFIAWQDVVDTDEPALAADEAEGAQE